MMRYAKLVHYEFHRFRYIYLTLMAVTLLSQLLGLLWYAFDRVSSAKETMLQEAISASEYTMKYGFTSYYRYTSNSLWFMAPIAICVTTLLIYVFLIWYRDWLGKNMFIYRLFMLPASRSAVYLAKLSLIMYMVWGLIAWQLALLPLQDQLFQAIVPAALRDADTLMDVIQYHPLFQLLIPATFIDFVISYGLGMMGVLLIFTAILMERSYRVKGIIGGLFYLAGAVVLFLLPIFISEVWFRDYLYPMELFLLELVLCLLIIAVSFTYSSYLLRKKITV